MRRTILFYVFIAVSMIAKAQSRIPYTTYEPVLPDYSRSTPILPRVPNYDIPYTTYTPTETVVTGTTYKATVLYESSTGYENTYKLPVVVNKGSVDKIIFNDKGGCVHVGINNSGYKYYGGKLKYIKEYDVYATEVTIVYSNSWQRYTIYIE
jgi:hypothetical protein